jgi:hypothetical protein
MFRSFTATPDVTPFQAVPVAINLDETNKVASLWSKISESFDFAEVDKNDDRFTVSSTKYFGRKVMMRPNLPFSVGLLCVSLKQTKTNLLAMIELVCWQRAVLIVRPYGPYGLAVI